MLELWHNTDTDEYILKEDGHKEKLSRMAGDFLCECARNNEVLQKENQKLRDFIRDLGIVNYDI